MFLNCNCTLAIQGRGLVNAQYTRHRITRHMFFNKQSSLIALTKKGPNVKALLLIPAEERFQLGAGRLIW